MKKIIILITIAVAGFNGFIQAQKPAVVVSDKSGWHKIGETTANFEKESDEVDVLLADKFAALKFKVTDAPIHITDLDVYYEDGTKQNIVIGSNIKKAGESSKEIDIKGGGEKSIDKIQFHYKTVENAKDKKAHVEIWGKKTNTDKMNKDQDKGEKKENKAEKKAEKKADKEARKEERKD